MGPFLRTVGAFVRHAMHCVKNIGALFKSDVPSSYILFELVFQALGPRPAFFWPGKSLAARSRPGLEGGLWEVLSPYQGTVLKSYKGSHYSLRKIILRKGFWKLWVGGVFM